MVKHTLKSTIGESNKYYIKAKFTLYDLEGQHTIAYNGYINKDIYNTILEKTRTVENHGCYFSTEHRISDNEKNIYMRTEEGTPAGMQLCVAIGAIHVINEPTSNDVTNIGTPEQYTKWLETVGYCVGSEL